MAMNPNSKKALCPKAPVDLTGEALAEWPRITDDLFKAGKLEKTDRMMIIAFCNLWAVYHHLNQQVSTLGGVIVNKNGMTGATAQWKEMLKATKELRIMLIEMGLTPAARGLIVRTEAPQTDEFGL